ncbi:hypothetical protein AOQ84DRAFT_329797 [Glonium stellatum]|uniref:Uncharacterized protein n=1 Tax=Glonium stellatum TaxID=574774 RepID=A0A8E2FED0_9PEZI|nr:hypothetical protein AOQ84DRAFT_329797 [Glonium stellatum]
MSYHELSIVVDGRGDDPNHRSHWSFLLSTPGARFGNLFHVQVIDPDHLIYQFERQSDHLIQSHGEGRLLVARIGAWRYRQAEDIISREPAPRNGKDGCQEWILSCVISLEVEEIVPEGTAAWIEPLVGLPSTQLAERVGKRWIPADA